MGDGLKADIGSLRTGGTDFGRIGKDYQGLVDTLQNGLTSLEGQGTRPGEMTTSARSSASSTKACGTACTSPWATSPRSCRKSAAD